MNFQELLHIAAVSGGILYVIVFLLLVGLTIIVDRTWYLAKIVRQGELIAGTVLEMEDVDRDALMDLAVRTAKYPQGASWKWRSSIPT